jgi:putative ABC transport system permease protein
MEDLWQDLSFGLRLLRRNLGFTTVAVLTLALGIGANTAIFSLVDSILLRPLPYTQPENLVQLIQSYPEKGLNDWNLSLANFADYRDHAHSFEAIAGYNSRASRLVSDGVDLTGVGESQRLQTTRVTGDFFRVLGVGPMLGRTFLPEEETPGKNNVCVLSYGLWQNRFGGDPSIVGNSLALDNVPTQVVGVMPLGFAFPSPETELWLPLGLDYTRRHPYFLTGIARLKPGVGIGAAQSETTAILWDGARENPDSVSRADPPPEGSGLKTVVTPLQRALTGKSTTPLLVLLSAVFFVLLIACANIANLLLARTANRAREISLRLAMGAQPGRVIRQLLTESFMLALIGATAGVAIAWWGVKMLGRLPVQGIPRIEEVSLNPKVLVFTGILAVFTGLLFGLAPALRAAHLGLEVGLREGSRGAASGSARGLSRWLVRFEVALSLMLLIGAGLLLKSFRQLLAVDTGFQPEAVLTTHLDLPARSYATSAQSVQFYQHLLDQAHPLPGMHSLAVVNHLPLSGDRESDSYVVEGFEPTGTAEPPQARIVVVSSGYFDTIGIPLFSGRDFLESDLTNSPPIAIIDEPLAHLYWPNGDGVGKRMKFSWASANAPWMTVVGVVAGIRDGNLAEKAQPHMYLPYQQYSIPAQPMYLALRAAGTDSAAISEVREVVRGLDAGVPISKIHPMTEVVDRTLNSQRLTNLLLEAFAGLALLLASIGIYGVMSVHVGSRTSEFGIRLALGAEPATLLRSVLNEGLLLTAVGIGAGLLGALALTRAMSGLLFQVAATDLTVFAAVPILLAAVAVIACYLPARRAARVNPMMALRYE